MILQIGFGTDIPLSEEIKMSHRFCLWLRILLGGGLLMAASATSCVSDMIRDAGDNLNEWADDIDGENDIDDIDNFFGDLGDLFD